MSPRHGRSVTIAVANTREPEVGETTSPVPQTVLRSLSRRAPIEAKGAGPGAPPLKAATIEPTAPALWVIGRTLHWAFVGLEYSAWTLWSDLHGNATERERGRRIRRAFQSAGGAAGKIGQELSLRLDLLSYEVCDELARIPSRGPALPLSQVIAVLEQAAGKPIHETFRVFDPNPIYSGITACVYQAILRSGEEVVVKVRRPGAKEQIAAELRCLEGFTLIPEVLAIVKPGFFEELRQALRQSLLKEIDLTQEARCQRLFRTWARRTRPSWLSAPKTYSRYSTSDVMVSERVEGIRVSELLAFVEAADHEALAALKSHGITPRKVARRLFQTDFWGCFEALFFDGDPTPSDIVVLPGSRLIHLDFGSCESVSQNDRAHYSELMQRLLEEDAAGMAEVALQLLAPLPPIDVYELKKAIEMECHRFILATRDKAAAWWERGSGSLWLGILKSARAFGAPVRIQILRTARAAFLYQSAALRLDPKLRLAREYRRHLRSAVRREAQRSRRQAEGVSGAEIAARLVVLAEDAARGARRARWALSVAADIPAALYSAIGKAAYFARSFIQFGWRTAVLALLAGMAGIVWKRLTHASPELPWLSFLWQRVWQNPIFLFLAAINLAITVRRVLFRLNDRDLNSSDR